MIQFVVSEILYKIG